METKTKKNILPPTDSLAIEMRIWGKNDLNLQQKLLLGYIISMLNSNPTFYASNGHLHSAFGLDKKTVSAAFKLFKKRGWMDVDDKTGGNRLVIINARQKARLLEYIGTVEAYKVTMAELKEKNIKKNKEMKAKAKAKTPAKVQEPTETEALKIMKEGFAATCASEPSLMIEEEDNESGLTQEEHDTSFSLGPDSDMEEQSTPSSITAEVNTPNEINLEYSFRMDVVDPTKLIRRYIPANIYYDKIIEDLNSWWEKNGHGIFMLDHLITFLGQYSHLSTVNTNLPLRNHIRDIIYGLNEDIKESKAASGTK
jgi:hypothetical protein